MADNDSLLNRWQSAGVLDAATAARIRAWEQDQQKSSGLRWQGLVALILGAILLATGVVLFVSAHWDQLSPAWRYVTVIALVTVFHVAGSLTRNSYLTLSTALHAVGTASTGAAIALVGQIFNIEGHWPAAVLLWALAALAGWLLLRDQAQQTLTLLLIPAWIASEIGYGASSHIGAEVYIGRTLIVWSLLYLTFFLNSKHKAVQGILFAAAAAASVAGVALAVTGWHSWSPDQTPLSLFTRTWAWFAIAALPLFLAFFRMRRALIPVAAAFVFSLVLPWLSRTYSDTVHYRTYSRSEILTQPGIFSHILVAAFAVFVAWWGVRQSSRALVNLGIAGFGLAVAWFYFSDIFNTVGRALGLIGLGILFLAGGWALDKARHRLLGQIGKARPAAPEAQ